jgi:hypothetical protein
VESKREIATRALASDHTAIFLPRAVFLDYVRNIAALLNLLNITGQQGGMYTDVDVCNVRFSILNLSVCSVVTPCAEETVNSKLTKR